MQKILLFFILILLPWLSFSQEESQPMSWSQSMRESVTPIVLDPLETAQIIREDSINDLDKSLPWRYGIERTLQINSEEHGVWSNLETGGRIWRVALTSPEAVNLSVNFDKFHLPVGSKLHFYNNDRTDISKTYTVLDNRENRVFSSWFVDGETIWIEYYEPTYAPGIVKLNIGSIVHGYRMGAVNQFLDQGRGLNDSGDCNYDVNCGIGSDFESKKSLLKKAVALLNLGNGYLCSAVLLNNTSEDKTPYLLTGNHCLDFSDPGLWSVRFNWVSPSPACGDGTESENIETNFTLSGANLVANNVESDFALVELSNDIPPSWDVVFAGWDNSDTDPLFEVGIHHPNGDIMKICRDDSGAVKEVANGTQVWLIEGVSQGNGDGWEIGTTESGSSGSPLFDQNGRIIGQLFGGLASCNGLETNADYDIYGRFGVSWNAGNTPETRLADWLDPEATGLETIEILQNILNVQDNELVGNLDIFPNPANNILEIMNNRYPNLTYRFYNLLGQEIKNGSLSNTINYISVSAFQEGIYLLHLRDEDSNSEITKKIVIER